MSHHRGNYMNRFVSASSNSAASTSNSYGSRSESMNSVPPPSQAFDRNPVPPPPPFSASREQDKRKEIEYMNLVHYGAKKEPTVRKQRMYDDAYLEGEDSDEDDRSSRHSSSRSRKEKEKAKEVVEDDEEDDLDAFMAGINAQASKDKAESVRKELNRQTGTDVDEKKKGIGRADIDEEDMQESLFKYLEEKKEKAAEEEEEYEYDQDGNVIWSWKKVIDPLPPLDHSTVEYQPFHKNFYTVHEDILKMNHAQAQELRRSLGLRVGGFNAPRPVCSFGHFGFDKGIMDMIVRSEFERPTPIQAQAIPAALGGRDVLGIAKTGSGKTAAYLWPAIMHIIDQPPLKAGDGPIALIVVPTRELALQVYQEAKKFCRAYDLNVICAYGGGSKWEQSNELKDTGAEIVVCTPGRIIDLVKMEATNFTRTTFLVFDEADRMFDMGFEAQVKSISDHIRPDRQCLMFSATFKSKVERLARDALQDPVRIVQGEVGEANADIVQHVEILSSQDAKWGWLHSRLVEFGSNGKVLIFVTKKLDAENLAKRLQTRDFKLVLLHGDMLQGERTEHLQSFRKKINIMVATDVAARGLDIPEIRTVINYDLARDIDTHVHRIGRTGRAGQQGSAYTLLTDKDFEMAGHLVRNLESVNQEVPENLMNLAMKSQWFRNRRQNGGTARAVARTGLGYQPREKTGHGGGEVNLDPLRDFGNSRTTRDLVKSATAAASNVAATPSYAPSSSSAPSAPSAPSGVAAPTNRLQAMKQAFKSSYSRTFTKQEDSSDYAKMVPTDPRPEWKKKIDEINAQFANQKSSSSNHQQQDGETQKKRSRWQ